MIELEGLKPHEVAALIPHRPILVGYRGSVAHGMYVPPTEETGIDDVDILAVYIPDLVAYFGRHTDPPRGKDVKIGKWDSAAYEVRHMVALLCNGNPNVTSLLWLKPEQVIHIEREGEMLMAARKLFLSKRAYHSFGGYAHGQLKRMTSFHDLGMGACGCEGQFHQDGCAVAVERGRGSTKRFATGFMGEKRKALVEKSGYDTKNAAHLLRILKLGIEALSTGELIVDRRDAGDAEELLAVKRGEWLLGDVQAEAERLFQKLREAKDSSPLPDEPDYRAVDVLLQDILCYAHATNVVLRREAVLHPLPPLGRPTGGAEAQEPTS